MCCFVALRSLTVVVWFARKYQKQRRVLELGAGMGVCGLIAHKTGASAVVLTDGDDSAVKKIQQVSRRGSDEDDSIKSVLPRAKRA